MLLRLGLGEEREREREAIAAIDRERKHDLGLWITRPLGVPERCLLTCQNETQK